MNNRIISLPMNHMKTHKKIYLANNIVLIEKNIIIRISLRIHFDIYNYFIFKNK